MNEPNEDLITPPTAEEQKSGICVWYDRKTDPDMLFVSIPLAQLAENKFGSVFLRGYLEEVIKGEALFHIRNKILKKAQSCS